MRAVAARQSPASSSTSASTCLRTKFCSSGSSRPATSVTASSETSTRCGNASRKKPEMRTVTSMRGRPSSSSGITSSPTMRRVSGCHFGRTPSSARISPASSPAVRIAAVPQTTMPTVSGMLVVRGQQRVGELRAGLVGEVGRQRARVDAVHVAAGREHVEPSARGRAGRARDHVVAVQAADQRGDLVGRREQLREHFRPRRARARRRSPARPSWCRRPGTRRGSRAGDRSPAPPRGSPAGAGSR